MSVLSQLPRPLKILDVGGEEIFWERLGFTNLGEDFEITLLNLSKVQTRNPNFVSISGDGRDLGRFNDDEFDLVFSNSVIEHVGSFDDQKRMADEVQRVGRRLILQAPNRFFPIETHFFYPCFQFLPLRLRLFLGTRWDIGWFKHVKGENKVELIRSLRLLSHRELRHLFPDATIKREKFSGITKSFTLFQGEGVIL